MKIDVPSQRTIEGIDDQATSEEIIYWMALTEAKMKVANWKEALMRLGMKRGMTLASLIVITGILLSACGPANGSSTATPWATERPTISAPTNEPTETLVWTPTSTPVPTETMTLPTLTPEATAVPVPEGLASVPDGYSAILNPDQSWGYAEGVGVDALPVPFLTVDDEGAHFDLDGVSIDIPTADIHDRIMVGQEGALQIYNEAGTGIDYAWDTENNVWIVAVEALYMDIVSPENFTPIQSMADLENLARLERMVLPPFPENTHFPPLDMIIYNSDLQFATKDQSVEYNFFSPLGGLPEGMTSPFRTVNMIVLKANEAEGRIYDSYILTEQVYNPDGSFSLLHFGGYADISTAPGLGIRGFSEAIERLAVGTSVHPSIFMLPQDRFDQSDIPNWDVWNAWSYLSPEVHDLDSNLVMTEIAALIDEWYRSGHVPTRLEELILTGIRYWWN